MIGLFVQRWVKLENDATYVAGINAFWVNHLRSASPGVPLPRESVKDLADFLWPPSSTEESPWRALWIEGAGWWSSSYVAGIADGFPRRLHACPFSSLCPTCRKTKRSGRSCGRVFHGLSLALVQDRKPVISGSTHGMRATRFPKLWKCLNFFSRTALQSCLEIVPLKGKNEIN